MTLNIRFHVDPGHGWLEVPASEVKRLGLETIISGFSHRSPDGATWYLEEDCDMTIFLAALARDLKTTVDDVLKGQPTTHHTWDAPCRRYPCIAELRVAGKLPDACGPSIYGNALNLATEQLTAERAARSKALLHGRK